MGASYPLGRPALWTYREIVEEFSFGPWERAGLVPMPVPVIRLSPDRGRVRPAPVPGRHRPAATAQVRQHRPPRLGQVRLRVRSAIDGGRPRPRREAGRRPGAVAGPGRLTRGVGRRAAGRDARLPATRSGDLISGARGLTGYAPGRAPDPDPRPRRRLARRRAVDRGGRRRDHRRGEPPARHCGAAAAELSSTGDRRPCPRSTPPLRRLLVLSDEVDGLGMTTRQALTQVVAGDLAGCPRRSPTGTTQVRDRQGRGGRLEAAALADIPGVTRRTAAHASPTR